MNVRQLQEEVPVGALALAQGKFRLHVQRLAPDVPTCPLPGRLRRTDAARAVLDCDLNRVELVGQLFPFRGAVLEACRRARERSPSPKTFARMVACGQTITHLPHSMHRSGSHTGTSSAMLRFSHCAVAVGHVPSAGRRSRGARRLGPPKFRRSRSARSRARQRDRRGAVEPLAARAGT